MSFRRDLLTIFGRVKPSAFDGQLSSTQFLSFIEVYISLKATGYISGIKQRIIDKISTIIFKTTVEISQHLTGTVINNIVALPFCLNRKRLNYISFLG